MKLLRLLIVFSLIFLFTANFLKAEEEKVEAGPVCVVKVDGVVERGLLYVIRRGVKEAKAVNASAIILDMDTPGGRLDTAEKIIRLLLNVPEDIKTYTYVNPDALSAGSLIALATDEIYIAPSGRIGASAIIQGSGEDIPDGDMKAKVYSASMALMESTASRKGHDPNIVRAMMDKDFEYKIGDEVIVEEGELLTLSDQTAVKTYGTNSTPILAVAVVDNLDDMIKDIGLGDREVVDVIPTNAEKIARWIETFSVLFLMGGVLGIYIEIKTPGFGFPGISGVVLLAIFFWGHQVAGLSGSLEVIIFILGVILVALEVFVIPGFGVAGISGIICIIISLFLAMVEHAPWDPSFSVPTKEILGAMDKLGISFVLIIIVAMVLAMFLPKTKMFSKIALVDELPTGSSEKIKSSAGVVEEQPLVGLQGIAFSSLRPSGTGLFNNRRYNVISNGDFIEKDSNIVVVEVQDNNHILVERIG
jgi:membrane-bound serine protease (ClpP class)